MSTHPAPVVAVVEDRRDLDAWIASRRDHHRQAAGVLTRIAGRQALSHAADATLTGLGKDPWLTVSKRPAELLAGAWLTVGDATDAIIGYPQLLSDWLRPQVLEWFVNLGVRPWCVFTFFEDRRDIDAKAAELAEAWGVEVVGAEALAEAWPDRDRQPSAPSPANPSGLPLLPRTDGIRFRSTARTLLEPDDFATVDAAMAAEVKAFNAALTQSRSPYRAATFQRIVHERLMRTVDTEELLLCARAAQIAGLRRGYHVKVDLTTLAGAAEALPRPGLAGPQRWWDRLDAYRDPDPGAAAALLTAGMDAEALPELTVGSVHWKPGTARVGTGDDTLSITGPPARFVGALRALRHLSGASGDDRLFTTHRAGTIEVKQVYRLVVAAERNTGVEVVPDLTRRQPKAVNWLARHGITVDYLRRARTTGAGR